MPEIDLNLMPDNVLIGRHRPSGHPDHVPYICCRTNMVCLDRIPVTDEEIEACNSALKVIAEAFS
jgi:hypothetical protein